MRDSKRTARSLNAKIIKMVQRRFPGHNLNFYDYGSGDCLMVSISRKDYTGSSFDLRVSNDGTVSSVRIENSNKKLSDVAKKLGEW